MFAEPTLYGGGACADRREPIALDELVRRLRNQRKCQTRDRAAIETGRLLAETRLSPSSLPPLPSCPRRHTRTLLHRDDELEVLLVRWDEGAVTPIHGHERQHCWLTPIVGALAVQNYQRVDGGDGDGRAFIEADDGAILLPGEIDHRDPVAEIHQVRVALESLEAVTLHVYARPLDRCLVYDLDRCRCVWQPLRYDAIIRRPVRRRRAPSSR